ncbi:MAG: hypothetical protein AAFY72_06800 [Cyanobacteria bacterium J06649_4]
MLKFFWPILFLSLLIIPSSLKQADADQLTHPPQQQTFSAQPYRLTITAANSWQTPSAIATLYEGNIRRWQKTLPHQYGPRFAVVSTSGHVLLVDEFINVASPYTLTVFAPTGELIAQHSFADIKQTLNLNAIDLTRQATSGWWVSSPPQLNTREDHVRIEAGGSTLEVSLLTGAIAPPP